MHPPRISARRVFIWLSSLMEGAILKLLRWWSVLRQLAFSLMPDDSPTELVSAALSGDRHAWDELVDRYSGLVWSIIRSMALRESDRADVYQAVFLKLTEHLSRINPPALPGWLITVTRNECYDVARRRQRQPIPTEHLDERPPDAGGMDPIGQVDESVDASVVVAALKRLSAKCQHLLRLLSAPEEFSYTEIAEILEMPVGSIGPTRGRCLKQLTSTPEIAGLARAEGWEPSDA